MVRWCIHISGKPALITQMRKVPAGERSDEKNRKLFQKLFFFFSYYSICIDNQFSRFASKLVNLYITVVKYDDWEKFTKEIEDLNVNMNNFTQVVQTVESNLNLM